MKRTRLITILIAAVVLGLLTFAIFHSREPRYQGRTLTEWIEEAESATEKIYTDPMAVTSNPGWQSASNAVRQMAPDAIPLLVKWFKAEDASLKYRAIRWLDAQSYLHLRIRGSRDRKTIGLVGFQLLGKEARPAWPALVEMTSAPDPRLRTRALDCLAVTGVDEQTLVPVLRRMIHDTNCQLLAAHMFISVSPKEAEAAGVYNIFPELKSYPGNQSATNQPAPK